MDNEMFQSCHVGSECLNLFGIVVEVRFERQSLTICSKFRTSDYHELYCAFWVITEEKLPSIKKESVRM